MDLEKFYMTIEYLRLPKSETANDWLKEFKAQQLCSKTVLEAGVLHIRFVVDEELIVNFINEVIAYNSLYFSHVQIILMMMAGWENLPVQGHQLRFPVNENGQTRPYHQLNIHLSTPEHKLKVSCEMLSLSLSMIPYLSPLSMPVVHWVQVIFIPSQLHWHWQPCLLEERGPGSPKVPIFNRHLTLIYMLHVK